MNENIDTSPQKLQSTAKIALKRPSSLARMSGGRAAQIADAIENDARLQDANISVRDILTAHPQARVLMVAEAVRGLGAEVQCWSSKTQEYIPKIDYPTRLKSTAWLASYSDGLPAQRAESPTTTTPTKPEMSYDEALRRSPALRDAARRALLRAETAVAKAADDEREASRSASS
jgi:hypothetical protein